MTQTVLRQVCLTALIGALACAWSATGSAAGRHAESHVSHRASHHAARHAAAQVGPLPAVKEFVASLTQRRTADVLVDVSLVDEVPPREWSGPGAFEAWTTSLRLAGGTAESRVALHGSSRTDRDMAYVIAPVLYSYQRRGAVVIQPATMAISLRREGAGWRITGWAWAGANPEPAEQATAVSRYLPAG
jgi:hypothetical protein